MSDKNIQEAEVGSGTKVADTKQSEKRAQLTLKSIQLRLKQEKERAALQQQKKSLRVKEDVEVVEESFSPSQIAALKAEYSKINTVDPDSDTYKKLIAMLDRLDLKSLKSLAGAEIKFVSKLAQNRVARKSMKEEVQLDELSNDKLADYKKKAGEDASKADKEGDTKKGNKRFSGIMKATKKQFDNDAKGEKNESVTEASQRVDSLVTDALKIMKGSELKDAVQALKTVLGDREYNDRRGHYNFYVKQLVDMYGKKTNEELSPKQKEIDKNKNGKIDGFDLAHLRKKTEELSPAQKAIDKNKNGKIDGTDLAHLRDKKKPQGADFAAQRRKERLASNGRMDEAKSDYEVYHKDYSGAVQTAIKQAEKRGFEVDMDDWHDKVATGPKKPSAGKTNSFSVKLKKDGKESKKALHLQVYNMDNHKYELNMYIEDIQLDELNKDTLHSYAKKSEKDQDDQYNKIGKGIRDNDPKSANKAGHKFSMRSIGQNRAEKRLAKEAASPAQQAAIAIAMKKAGKKPKDMEESDAYDKNVKPSDKPHDKEAAAKRAKLAALAARKKMTEGLMDKIKAIKRGMQAKDKADAHWDKAGDPKNPEAKKDLKKAVRYTNLLNKEGAGTVGNVSVNEEEITEAKKKSWKDMRKKTKNEEAPNKPTIKKGDALTGKREPIEINPELKEPAT
jgi:hypothetical protein